MGPLRKWLFAGLLVIVPLAITVWVLQWIVSTLDQTLQILPQAWHPDRLLGFHIPGFGVLLALIILLTAGAITSNFLGKKLVRWGQVRAALWLLRRGADPNLPDGRGWTAVHQAASRGNGRMLKALLDAGGDPLRQDRFGMTPNDVARSKRMLVMST